ncbi:MAG: type II secretion system F family protein [Clostridia bacterium]|nr:type II secretion system F family protein [Clostridia bacterium]
MPLYTYKVKNEAGKIFTGSTKINSEAELVVLLEEKGYTPVEIKVRNAFTDISTISIFKPKVKVKDLAIFCRQFAIVLEAGVPIASALDVLREQAENVTLKECVDDIYENIQKGTSLSNAFKQHINIFPEILINMIESGEISGQLDKVFIRMADHFEKEYKLVHKIRGAMMYPMMVCIVAVAVVIILLTFVLPQFTKVLTDLKVDLPFITKLMINISNFFKGFWWLVVMLLVGVVIGLRYYFKSEKGKKVIGTLAIKMPIIKNVTKNVITARFTRTLGTLIASGVLLIQALEVVQKIMGNAIIADKLNDVINEVKKGKGLTPSLNNVKYFPPMVMSMIKIGEESGNLDFSLDKSADFYDQEVESSTQRLMSVLEPVMIVVLACIVGFILISVLLPMMSIYENAGKAA